MCRKREFSYIIPLPRTFGFLPSFMPLVSLHLLCVLPYHPFLPFVRVSSIFKGLSAHRIIISSCVHSCQSSLIHAVSTDLSKECWTSLTTKTSQFNSGFAVSLLSLVNFHKRIIFNVSKCIPDMACIDTRMAYYQYTIIVHLDSKMFSSSLLLVLQQKSL